MVASAASIRSVRWQVPPSNGGAHRHYLALVRGETSGFWPFVQRAGLGLASLPYGAAVRFRNIAFDRGWTRTHRALVPVVSVGNLTVGGTGKTPCVEYVARFYREHDVRAAILSRGYGNEAGPNDEALVLEDNLPDVPHLQGPDRVALAQAAVEELESELLILDDGFQHRRLARNLDLVLIDATAPWGHGRLLPRGLLREPISSLKRASLILLTRCDQVETAAKRELARFIAHKVPQTPLVETTHRPLDLVASDGSVSSLAALQSSPVAAFCGLGNPDAFRRTLTNLGAQLSAFRIFPDHHGYTRADVEDLYAWTHSLPPRSLIVTTQKDLVKLRIATLGDWPLWALRIRLHIEAGEDVLTRKLLSVLAPGEEQS